MSKRSRRNRVFKKGDRVIISQRYKGAVGPKVHGRAGVIHKVSYPPGGGKFVLVHLDGESVLSVILTFADELDREPAPADVVAQAASDPEGRKLVQDILDRKAAQDD